MKHSSYFGKELPRAPGAWENRMCVVHVSACTAWLLYGNRYHMRSTCDHGSVYGTFTHAHCCLLFITRFHHVPSMALCTVDYKRHPGRRTGHVTFTPPKGTCPTHLDSSKDMVCGSQEAVASSGCQVGCSSRAAMTLNTMEQTAAAAAAAVAAHPQYVTHRRYGRLACLADSMPYCCCYRYSHRLP